MKLAFGMKAHSGWATLVVIGKRDADPVLADRRRIVSPRLTDSSSMREANSW